jgi:hypothetical protein
MNTISIEAARKLLSAELTDQQIDRCIQSAMTDAAQWHAEAAADELPDIETMHLDWAIDDDLQEAGVDGYGMQRLSFAIAKAIAA